MTECISRQLAFQTTETHFVLDPEDKASVVGAVYSFIGEARSPATTARVKRLIGAMTAGRRGPGQQSEG